MTWQYQYTPYIWPMLVSAAFTAALMIYVWRRRSVPGAFSIVISMLATLLWAVGAALELAAVDVPTQVLWSKFQAVWLLPANTAVLCFVLEYANLGRWLTRRTLALLAIPPLLDLVLILTNDAHHWLWLGFSLDGYVRPVYGSGTWALLGYNYALVALQSIILLRLFVRSPLHRWPVGLILICRLVVFMAYRLDVTNRNPFAPMDPVVLGLTFTAAMFTLALFGFHLFDLIPVARETVIEQMREGMLVLDARQRIVDLNPAAEKILGVPAARARGRNAIQVLPACPGLSAQLDDPGTALAEISIGAGHAARYYALHLSPLQDRRGAALGHLILLHDVTEPKWAQAQIVEQQRALAMLDERARLARELHDGQGQVLGYVKMRAQVARDLLAQNQTAQVDAYLANLIAVAQAAHTDIREYLLGVKTDRLAEQAFVSTLRQYLEQFSQNYGIRAELHVPPELTDAGVALARNAFEPTVEVQLLRIIQEALTNARKHARVACVEVSVTMQAGQAHVTIQDDGQGFDPDLLAHTQPTFGLRFMRERAEEMRGCLDVQSAPGQGTRVMVQVPLRGARVQEGKG